MARTRDELRGNDVMASGEIDYVNVAENIRLAKADVVEAIDQFIRIGDYGMLTLYKAPDQDVHWFDENENLIDLTTSEQKILSLTPDMELTPDDTSIIVSGRIDNTTNQDRTAYVVIKVDGSQVGPTVEIELLQEETGKIFSINGSITQTYPADTVVSIDIYASSNNALQLNGVTSSAKMRITKAQAAPVIVAGGITQDVIVGDGANEKTFHIANGLITNIT